MTLRGRLRSLAYRYVGGAALILLYHRVTRLDRDPQLLAVDPERFSEHLRILSARFEPVSVSDLADGLRRRRVPQRAVAVTFDDGYADNLLEAEPLLREYGIPATVYVSSGYVDSRREYWWDELERLLLGPGVLPRRLEIDEPFMRIADTLGPLAEYTEEDAQRDSGWNVLMPPTNERQRLYLEVAEKMRPLSSAQRELVLQTLHETAGLPHVQRATHRPLDVRDLVRLDSSEYVEVGGHTVTHQVLSVRTVSEQEAEITEDAMALSEMCGRPMRTFSYPFGGLADYSDASVDIVRRAGYESACSNHVGVVKPWTDPYRLPRMVVRDWTSEELSRRLEEWFHAPR